MSLLRKRNPLALVRNIAAAVLTAAPALNILTIANKGAGNPSNDDARWLPRFLGPVLAGHYNWLHFVRDTFSNAHCKVFPALVYILLARMTSLNIYSVLYVGVGLAALRLVLLHDAIAYPIEKAPRWLKLALRPVLSCLIFSVSQISTFDLDLQTTITNLNLLGFAVAIWGIVRFPARWRGACLVALGLWGGNALVRCGDRNVAVARRRDGAHAIPELEALRADSRSGGGYVYSLSSLCRLGTCRGD